MFFTCQNCGKEITIYIYSAHKEQKKETLYCSSCSSHQEIQDETCTDCGLHYSAFLETGLLGCASCYENFASSLEKLMEKYQNVLPGAKAFAAGCKTTPLAKARSQELCEYVWGRGPKKTLVTRPPKKKDSKSPPFDGQGPIQSVRLRAARNIHGLPYLHCLEFQQRKRLQAGLLSFQSALALHWDTDPPAKIATDDEDHLRVSWHFSWQNKTHALHSLKYCLEQIRILDTLYEWQYHPSYGFLTACPGIGGLALRLSFQLHIPALLQSKYWPTWHKNLQKTGCEIRGQQGELSRLGSTIQISNRCWHWGIDPEKEILPFLCIIESLVRAEYTADSAGSSIKEPAN